MDPLQETTLSSQQIYQGRLLDVWKDAVRLPDGRTSSREYIRHSGAVAMVPILPDGNLLLIRQYRYPIRESTLEIPAGKFDPGEDSLTTARRELEEETGYRAGEFAYMTRINPCLGYSDEIIWLYLARDLSAGESAQDHDEFIQVVPTTLTRTLDLIRDGTITDVKTIIGVLWLDKWKDSL